MTPLPAPVTRALAPGAAGAVPPFRRTPAAPRRKRRSGLVRWLRPLGPPLAVAVATAAATGWLVTSPRFGLARLEVTAGERVRAAWVEETLAPLAGRSLLRLPLPEVARRVKRHPWVAAVEIHKELPDRLLVAVRERRPAALVLRGESLWYADAEGGLIAPAAAGAHPELPRVRERAGSGTEDRAPGVPGALAVLAEIAVAQPGWAAGLEEIGVLGDEEFTVATSALPFPLRVRSGSAAAASRWLAALLPEILARYHSLEAVDLRFTRRIVLELAPPPASGEGPAGPATAAAAAGGPAVHPQSTHVREVRTYG